VNAGADDDIGGMRGEARHFIYPDLGEAIT